jgi:phosphatidylglycerol:prolipoprotein diacylglycerol transferase
MYWFCAAIGICAAFSIALFRAKNNTFHISAKHTFFVLLFAALGARIGAALFKLAGHIVLYSATPDFWKVGNIFTILRSGGVFYGGLFGGIFAALFYVRENGLIFRDVSDLLMPSIPIFHMFGRIGCFFAGCCYGRVSARGIMMPNGVSRIPVQWMEALFCLTILIGMLIFRPERKRPGILFPIYLVVYAIGRFIIEFFRGEANRGVFLLSTSQWISVLIVSSILLIFLSKSNKKFRGTYSPKFIG